MTPPRSARRRHGRQPGRPARPARARGRLALLVAIVLVAAAAGAVLATHAFGITETGRAVPAGGPQSANDPVAVAAATPPTPGVRTFEVGVVGSKGTQALDQSAALGAKVMRLEFTADTTVEQLAPLVGQLADRGIRMQPLVGWDNGTPAPDLTGVARWAAAFGPGGTFWAGRSDATAMTDIELGNENAFYYKSGTPDTKKYQDLATAYGRRSVDAARAVDTANRRVGLLVELETGDSGSSTWIDRALAAGGPDLVRLLHAPAIHPYGPDWRAKLDRSFRFAAKWGLRKPYAITEWGISTDDGVSLTDNYDWPVNLTYQQAADRLTTALAAMSALPGEVRQVMLYQLGDQGAHGSSTEREQFFGLLRKDGSDKGAYTTAVRTAYGRYS